MFGWEFNLHCKRTGRATKPVPCGVLEVLLSTRTSAARRCTRAGSSRPVSSRRRFSAAAAMPSSTASIIARPSRIAQAMPAAMASPLPIGLTTSSTGSGCEPVGLRRRGHPDRPGALRDHHPLGPAAIERPHGVEQLAVVVQRPAHGLGQLLAVRLDHQRLQVQARPAALRRGNRAPPGRAFARPVRDRTSWACPPAASR